MEHTKPKRSKRQSAQNIAFELFINGRAYTITATPFAIPTGDTMYRISYNNGPVHIFGWDEGLDRYAESDMLADVIPPIIEIGIAEKLNEFVSQIQDAA